LDRQNIGLRIGSHEKNFSDPKRIENKASYYTAPELLMGEEPTEYCDVYSFGVLTWYILTEKDPFDIKDMTRFKNHVITGHRPTIPQNMPPVLKEMMTRCWAKEPPTRPKFETLVKEMNWDKIITDTITRGQEEAEAFWLTLSGNKKGDVPESVPWPYFVRHFSKFLSIPNTNDLEKAIEWKCLKALLEESPHKNDITHQNFMRFLSWFGPVGRGSTEGIAYLKQIEKLLRQKWFHGNIGAVEAANRINSAKRTHIFLLRFSNKKHTYTMTFRGKKGETQHERLHKDKWTDIPSLISYVESETKRRHLQPCEYGWKNTYGHVFNDEIDSLYNTADTDQSSKKS